jgi:phage N-6-adenine-methyltransferase
VVKLPTDSRLGPDLRRGRRARHLTQAQLAAAAGLTAKTVGLLEQGRGNLGSFRAVLDQLDLDLVGRNLPAGATWGRRLAVLRRRRGLAQRELAELVGVTRPSLMALERHERGRLATLERVLVSLGAGAYLAPRGQPRAFYTHAGNASTHHAWETPAGLLAALRSVFGRFDLDPCASRKSRTRVPARVHLMPEDDGLSVPWRGTVFVNPPYGRTLPRWVAKARREVEAAHARAVVALLPARPDTAYWHADVAGKAVVYFLRGRLRFGAGGNSAPFPSALVVWGAWPEALAGLDAALPDAWRTT